MSIQKFFIFTSACVILLSSYSFATAATFNSTDVPKVIPDFANNLPGSVTSTLTVPAGVCTILTDVNVSVDITHPFVSDLSISVTHNASARTALLFLDSCTNNNFLVALFDDEAASLPPIVCAANGVYLPEAPLSALDGIDAAGTWTLSVTDQAPLDAGILNGWGITLTCGGSSLPVSIPGVNFFPSLQAAYDAPGATDITIQARTVDLSAPDFILDSDKAVTLEGGYDSAFSVNSGGYTVLTGTLTIQSGSLTVENLIIK